MQVGGTIKKIRLDLPFVVFQVLVIVYIFEKRITFNSELYERSKR